MHEPIILFMFDWEHENGVPVAPIIRRMQALRLEKIALELLESKRRKRLFVWDWQPDGVRMRAAELSGSRIAWSDPRYWLAKHARDDKP
jgi:hypothetical protein